MDQPTGALEKPGNRKSTSLKSRDAPFQYRSDNTGCFTPGVSMRTHQAIVLALLVLSIPAVSMPLEKARALEPEKYTVYCANDHIEVSFWDLEQMKVRNGSDVCQFQSYTSYSSALNFAQKNFGGEGASCSC